MATLETSGNLSGGNNSEAAAAQMAASILTQAAMKSGNGGNQPQTPSAFTGAAALGAITMAEKMTENGGQSRNLDMALENPLIGLLLHKSEGEAVPVALEQTCGPFPKWSIPDVNSKIKGGVQKVYIADITKTFTLALVRDVKEDYPLLLPLESLNDSTKTIGDLVGSLLPERAKRGLSIRLLSSPEEEIRTMPCDRVQEYIKEPYSTTIIVLLTSGPEEFKYCYDYDGPSPLALKLAYLQCLELIDAANKLKTFPLQAVYLSRSLVHLVVCLSEVDRSKMEGSLEVYYISGLNDLAAKLRSLLASEISILTTQSLQELYEEICEEYPGVVAIRQSFMSFQALGSLDREKYGTSSESLGTNTAVPRVASHQDSGLLRDENPRMTPEEIESASSEPSGHAHNAQSREECL